MTGHQLLVIDDEEPMRMAVTDILEMHGWTVITAENGKAGLALFRERQAEIDLVLLDLSMPGLSGEETFQLLRQIDPDIQVILSSGYNQAEVARRFNGQDHVGFIQKPYDERTLTSEVMRYVGQP